MASVHVSGEEVARALEGANLDPSSETYVEDLAEVVRDAGVSAVRNQIRVAVDELGRELDQVRLEGADPEREIDRYINLLRK